MVCPSESRIGHTRWWNMLRLSDPNVHLQLEWEVLLSLYMLSCAELKIKSLCLCTQYGLLWTNVQTQLSAGYRRINLPCAHKVWSVCRAPSRSTCWPTCTYVQMNRKQTWRIFFDQLWYPDNEQCALATCASRLRRSREVGIEINNDMFSRWE